ncbi:hypothetical protein [Algirhabdus cladophorae]|uniref:hypothetical protein n=1 Tax=Algirhabdus cladophorae TaxID=3377108 RepID=UPI003B84622E
MRSVSQPMQIALHLGLHNTDKDRLLKCILKNGDALQAQNIAAPGPSRYRRVLRETIQGLDGQLPNPGARDVMLDAICDTDRPDRLVMAFENFICVQNRVFENAAVYGPAEEKLIGLRNLFPLDEIELFVGLRDPATYIPALFNTVDETDFATFLHGVDPMTLRWSTLLHRIRAVLPDAALTVWCNEDTPLIWSQLIREISGLQDEAKLSGGFDLLAEIMSGEGMKRLRSYLGSHPPQTEVQKRRIIAAFLDKFALDDAIEEELDVPGWTDDYVEQLTQNYDDDVYEISRIPGVTFLSP